ncbi:MAG: hypothetical protein CM1200mP26_10550 [Acidimicrobiales bacterium]|nr:MAG: hypothetical protein CM1200mP26_10550 [Acidimicrobiales bacterium]
MTDTAGSQTDELDQEGTRRLRPNHAVIGLGVLVALFTAASGVASVVNEFHDDSPITREVFANIPGPLKLAFYSVIPLLIIYGAVLFSYRVQNWQRGAPDDRSTKPANVKRRFGDFRSGVYMQTLLRDPAAGVMHALIYFPFLILMAVTTVLEINHQVPEGMKFLHGDVYRAYTAVGDIAGVLYLVGVVWAILRRYGPRRFRPYRIRIKSKPEHAAVLLIFLAIGITGFGAEAFRIALQDATPGGYGAEPETWSVVGYPLAMAIGEANWLMDDVAGWHQGWWIAHVASFMAFLALLPITMIRHMFTSPLNMYLKDRSRPKGAMKPMPNLMETELESFGVATIEDFTWKQLLDTDSCTMCGRCTRSARRTPQASRWTPVRSCSRPARSWHPPVTHRFLPQSGPTPKLPCRRTGCSTASPTTNCGRAPRAGLRRALPSQHRNPGQDPGHATLPVANGVRLPQRAGCRLPVNGEYGQPVGHVPERAGRLGR